MNKTLGLAVTAIAVAFAGNVAQAGADTGSWYVSPRLQGIWLDDGRVADDNAGFAFSVGNLGAFSRDGIFSKATDVTNFGTSPPMGRRH